MHIHPDTFPNPQHWEVVFDTQEEAEHAVEVLDNLIKNKFTDVDSYREIIEKKQEGTKEKETK